MRIVVTGERAELYIDDGKRLAFIVTDLKYGAEQQGGVGLWLESGTLANFRNLQIVPDNQQSA